MAGSSAAGAVFQWGNKEAGTQSSYESMCFKGVWYNLHDCVFVRSGMKTPYVGKLMRMFQDEDGVPKMRIRWFLRPYELPVHVIKNLSKDVHNSNELFIAIGNVKGVEDVYVVEVIRGKAMVLCTARYGRNTIPSREHIDAADHVFNRAYDAINKKVVKMANILNKQLAEKFVNKTEWMAINENVEVGEARSATLEDTKPSKHQLTRTSSMDSSLSQGKKLKGIQKCTTD